MSDSSSTPSPIHDALLLGTSPVLLIEGLLRARAGQRVAFVDAQEEIGGVWTSTSLGPVEDIESVCLLLENYRGAYDYLEQTLGVPLEVMTPAPTLVTKGGSVIAYNSRARTLAKMLAALVRMPPVAIARGIEALAFGKVRFQRFARFRFAAVFRKLGILLRHPMGGDRRVRYFVGGAPRMLRDVRAQLCEAGAEFVRGHATELVAAAGAPVTLRTREGDVVRAHELVAGDSTSLESAVLDGERFAFEPREVVHRHVVVEVSGVPADTCSYVQMPHDPVVSRFNDVTPFCRGVADGHRVFIVQLVERREGAGESDLCREALQHLVARGLLPTTTELVRGGATEVRTQASRPSVAKTLRVRDERCERCGVTFLTTLGDLAWTVLLGRDRWAQWLGRTPRKSTRAKSVDPQDVAAPVGGTPRPVASC